MPPQGSKAPRARAGRRAGTTDSRSSKSEAAHTTTPQSAEPATTISEAPTQSAAIKQDDDEENTKPPTPPESTPAPIEQTPAPEDGIDAPGRPPVQRLGSLNTSRSASPAVRRGTSSRGKRGMVKPTFTGRRSKEEREALAKEALEREKARTQEQVKAAERKQKDAERRAKRDAERAVRGRGGYSGAMSGPFSLGSSREDRKVNYRNAGGFGGGSGSRATRIKDEGDAGEGSSGYRASGGGGSASSARRGGAEIESSSDEEDAAFPRKDIDLIEISSDEGEVAPVSRPLRSTLPVRIGRKEHQERTFGINTDASSEQSAKILEQAESKGQPLTAALLQQSTGKGKGKETEMAASKKPFKGVWQDSDETASPVKTEENSEDENAVAEAEQIGIVHQPKQELEPEPQDRAQAGDAVSKSKERIRAMAEPVLQTDEDRAEWARFQSNLTHIRAELGPDTTTSADVDPSGDVNMADAGSNTKKPTVRDNNVYLFQIPPLMPELVSTAIKKEPTEPSEPMPAATPAASSKSGVKVKVEEGATFTDINKAPETTRFASGNVGKLRVRQSGRTTLDWGGTSFELTPGNKVSFLQEVVSIHVVPEAQRVVPEDAGEAVSFGRVKGKFVVVPDWGQMLG
ncbi:hypothetical protein ACEQ8H_006527 [Pleosporales sp. CAS-2024a]